MAKAWHSEGIMSDMTIETLRRGDNRVYVLIEGKRTAVVDPGSAEPVRQFLRGRGLTLDLILITHHHWDHTGGCEDLRRSVPCRLAGPKGGSIPLDRAVADGDAIRFAGRSIEVLAVPGHTTHDVAYYLPSHKAVFTGDALFAAGCGRILGADAGRMWRSLCRLRALPDDTHVFDGHDYTLDNLEFAAALEPEDAAVQARLRRFRAAEAAGKPYEASTIGEEKQTNPFFRCDAPGFAAVLGMRGDDPAQVFAAVRSRKDRW
jgi:hydroxyacylglutathione hydrolase